MVGGTMALSEQLREAMAKRAGKSAEGGGGSKHPAPSGKERKVVDPYLEKVLDALEKDDQETADANAQKAVELLYSKFGYGEEDADRYLSAWFNWQGE